MTRVHGEESKGTWDAHRPPRDQETRGLQAISCSGGFLPPAAFGLKQAQCREHVTFEQ